MQGWVGYIEKLRSTFTKPGLPGGVAEKNSFSLGWKWVIITQFIYIQGLEAQLIDIIHSIPVC
jgi:hypothetical protein